MRITRSLLTILVPAVLLTLAPAAALASSNIVIINNDGPGEGFNDPTPAAPVGGNPGTTVGQQRLLAFQFAADLWGATLDSNVDVFISARFDPLTCTPTGAVLGSAGATNVFRDFPANGLYPGAEFALTWYPSALADKRFGVDILALFGFPGAADIVARFNSNLNGNPACLGGRGWYLGFDANHGTNIDLVAVLLHEMAHGLGFQQFASVTSGALFAGLPDVYNRRILDNTTNKYWSVMTDPERVASAINVRRVVFDGPEVTAAVPSVLAATPLLRITSPPAIAGNYLVGTAQFGPPLSPAGVTGTVVLGLDASNGSGILTTDGCTALTNAAAVAGKIALMDRGTCGFTIKVKNAQDAGAIAVLIADNVAGSPPPGMAGVDATIVIPSVRITLPDGNAIKAQLGSGVAGTLGIDLTVRAGADDLGRALLYTPNPVSPGSTISHWDTTASPNQLMEPAINGDLTHNVKPPFDLTLPLLRDIGWFADKDVDGLADTLDSCQTSDLGATIVIDGVDTGVANVLFTTGCTITDLINLEAAGAKNHGQFVSGVAHLLKALKDAGFITNQDKGVIQSIAAKSNLP